jgi:two-component system response regulator RegA
MAQISASAPPPLRWSICGSATATASTWSSALKRQRADARAIVLTGYGNIATAVTAVKLGAVDYLSKPADADDVVAPCWHRRRQAEPPQNPMSADRVRWEHIQRIYEMCNRNVSETARRLNMHRRTLQRILAKRAPR